MEKDPLFRPKVYEIPDFLDPNKRMQGEEVDGLHQVMIKLGFLMNKYRVIPKSYFRDAVIFLFLYLHFFNLLRIEHKSELSLHQNFLHIYHF